MNSGAVGKCGNGTFTTGSITVEKRRSAHPMREDVKQKHFSTSLREASIGACIQAPSLRGEAFGSNAWSGHRVRQGYGSQLLVSLEWFHAAVPTPFVAKLRKPTVGLSANHHPM